MHWEALLQLRSLRHLRLPTPESLFDVHQLGSLQNLVKVTITQACVLDLKPLSCVASLRVLMLVSVSSYASLGCLTRLETLKFIKTAAMPAVSQLSALTWLSLCEGSQADSLSQLGQLRSLSIHGLGDSWPEEATAALAAAVPAGLSELRHLSCGQRRLPPLHSLTQLTALKICCNNLSLPAELQDVRQLTGLVKLGLEGYRGCPQLQSDSVTVLFLYAGCIKKTNFPDLVGCPRLCHVMLNLSALHAAERYDICAEQLPAEAKTIWLDKHAGVSQLFMNMKAAETLRVRRVAGLGWSSNPAVLEAKNKD